MKSKFSNFPYCLTQPALLMTTFRQKILHAITSYMSRRPHRSFRRTARRDYARSLRLPGYFAFTSEVLSVIRRHVFLFSKVAVFFSVLSIIFVGLSSQASYADLSQILTEQDWTGLTNGWTSLGQMASLVFLGLSGGTNSELTDSQQLYALIILLLTWLTIVWLLRSAMAGNRPKLRDGLYNAGTPIIATGAIIIVLLIQLVPALVAVIAYSAASSTELLSSGFLAMIAGLVTSLFILLSIYWSVSTFFALIIVTIPGMYPWSALRSAGDIVTGRRLRILYRLLWLFIGNVLFVIAVVLTSVLVDKAVKNLLPALDPLPIVPLAISILSSIITIWSATYIYLLYRKVVEDDADPS